ncbi:hypothetical protein NQ318_010900 [Aromia moschata]|uniref:Uncharacterized protein n=1 Tax=Aromia moschata TaxID=1265417 RepID=A0AAV8XKD0_9CUCU|nr:hypothetical protein NQ318_010900 [Aromia moschata]
MAWIIRSPDTLGERVIIGYGNVCGKRGENEGCGKWENKTGPSPPTTSQYESTCTRSTPKPEERPSPLSPVAGGIRILVPHGTAMLIARRAETKCLAVLIRDPKPALSNPRLPL